MTERPEQTPAEGAETEPTPEEPTKARSGIKLSRATKGWFLLVVILVATLIFGGREDPEEDLALTGPDEFGFYRMASIQRSGEGFLQIPMPDFAGADAPQREPMTPEQVRQGLFADPSLPSFGNLEGDLLLVEFFDYRCPYCKLIATDIAELVAEDGGIKHIIVDWPQLGADSEYAARAAIAAGRQGAYGAFREALSQTRGEPGEALVFGIVEELGLDSQRMRRDMASEAVAQRVEKNSRLAESLRLRGTPTFVFGNAVIEGALSRGKLEELIAEQRSLRAAAGNTTQ